MSKNNYRVFISRCTADEEIMLRLKKHLIQMTEEYKTRGIDVEIWDMDFDCAGEYDADCCGGFLYELRRSEVMIPVITPNSTNYTTGLKYQVDELREARKSFGENIINVVPMVLGVMHLPQEIDDKLGAYSCASWDVAHGSVNEIPDYIFEMVVAKTKKLLDARIEGSYIKQVESTALLGNYGCSIENCFCVG